ncbi:MAG: hypothetical protein R6U27_16970 [Desulfobacterales bacterium]
MKRDKSSLCRWISTPFLVAFLMVNQAHGQDSAVFFDCGDIGVEARRILTNFNDERLKLEKKQQFLDKREDELKILQSEVDNKLKQLTELRNEMEKLLTRKNDAAREKIKKLSMIYQKRDPAGAALTLASMEKDLAVLILSMMRDKYAGKILDQMEKKKAVEYTTALGLLGHLESTDD